MIAEATVYRPARGRAQAPAAVGAEGTVTYGALRRQALALAARLPPGTREAVIVVDDRYLFAVALLGCLHAGVVVVLPPARTVEVVTALAARKGACCILVEGRAGDYGAARDRVVDVTLLAAEAQVFQGDDELDSVDAERPVAALCTSGTTGESVTWIKRARQLLGEGALWGRLLNVTPEERVLATVPPHHIYGLLFSILMPLSSGAAFSRRTPLLPIEVAGTSRQIEAAILVSVPSHLRSLLTLPPGALAPIRCIVSSGAPLPRDLGAALAERFSCEVVEVLGSTETGGIARRRGDRDDPWEPLPGVSVATSADGELRVRSPFSEDPATWFQAGDRVELLADGRLRHLGRTDSVVKVAGTRLDLTSLEARALALPGVTDAAALAEPVGGLRGVEPWLAAVAPSWTPRALRAALAPYFSATVLPRRVRLVPRLPRSEGGKLRRAELRALFDAVEPASEAPLSRHSGLTLGEPQIAPEDGIDVQRMSVSVAVDATYFDGHFPAEPVLPAVAQLAELIVPAVRRAWPDLGALEGAPRLKFSALIGPGDTLELVLRRRSGALRVDFTLSRGGVACASGALAFRGSTP